MDLNVITVVSSGAVHLGLYLKFFSVLYVLYDDISWFNGRFMSFVIYILRYLNFDESKYWREKLNCQNNHIYSIYTVQPKFAY